MKASSLKPMRTVSSVMHEPARPPYRSLKTHERHTSDDGRQQQQQQQQLQQQARLSSRDPNAILHLTDFFRGVGLGTQAEDDLKKAFAPTLTTHVSPVEEEAGMTMEDLNKFEMMLQQGCYRNTGSTSFALSDAMTPDVSQSNLSGTLGVERPTWPSPSPPQRTVVRLLPRLFSNFLLRRNGVVSRLRELGQAVVLQRLESEGKRLGLRTMTSRELGFLLSCVLNGGTRWEEDVEYLFRFFDWSGKGSMNFKDLLASAHLLFLSTAMQIAVHCKRVLREWVLDDSTISVADIDVMLTALSDVFGRSVGEVPALCDAVRRAVGNVMPMHTVPLATLRAEVMRVPTLRRCLSAIQWDGSIDWLKVLPAPPVDDCGDTQLERQKKLVQAAIANGRESTTSSVSEQDDDCCMDVCHPRFVADAYILSADGTLS